MFKRRLTSFLTIILISSTLVINSQENKLDNLILGGRCLEEPKIEEDIKVDNEDNVYSLERFFRPSNMYILNTKRNLISIDDYGKNPSDIKLNKELLKTFTEELKKYFSPKEKNYLLRDKKDLILEEKILRLGQLLYKERYDNDSKIKYGSIKDKEIINLTKDIKNYLFSKNNDNFKLEYNNFKESLNKINNYFYKINEDNNIKDIVVDTTLTDSKNKYMNNYIYNAIVNYANYNYKKETKNITKIKENDIIQEIILKHYLNNKKQTRKDILTTYFTNTSSKQKFRNKREIENAIRNINDEMDEAQKEFSKLFISNDYTK